MYIVRLCETNLKYAAADGEGWCNSFHIAGHCEVLCCTGKIYVYVSGSYQLQFNSIAIVKKTSSFSTLTSNNCYSVSTVSHQLLVRTVELNHQRHQVFTLLIPTD